MSRTAWIVTFVVSFLVFLCLCAVGLLSYGIYTVSTSPIATQVIDILSATPTTPTVTPEPEIIITPPPPEARDTLDTLRDTTVPLSDLRDLAGRLQGVENIPEVVAESAAEIPVGTVRTFNASDVDTNENFTVDAELAYATAHVYFWVEQGVDYNERKLQTLVDTFEEDIYPTNRDFFGSEWTPGVDGDPHVYMILARGLGESVAGYYSSVDEYSHLAHEYSNEIEVFYLNADNIGLGDEFTYGVLAHEFQHMIHWYQDRNEETWLNEGFSEVAAFINGYDPGGFDYLYATDPDQQLNSWPGGPGESSAHYGQSFLFLSYFLDRFGNEATKAVVSHAENGLESIDLVLSDLGLTDSLTGQPLTADDVFADWAAALYLNDPGVGDGRYSWRNYQSVPSPDTADEAASCPAPLGPRTVSQYGVDYIRITCAGNVTIRFTGSQQTRVVPPDPGSGDYFVWSNRGDESDMTLTRAFDLRAFSAPLTLSYQTWYDIEEDYDYVYVEASTDGGAHWAILTTPSGTDEDPSGNSYGWGYNHNSGGGSEPEWITERVDLSPYAGQEVLLRFEYVTDAAVNGAGMVLDDIVIPEMPYREDFENGDGGWDYAGWVRIQNRLPQTFRVQVIEKGNETKVAPVALDESQRGEYTVTLGGEVEEVIVVVSGTTRFSEEPASYEVEVTGGE